jgi:mRNA interferase MazF
MVTLGPASIVVVAFPFSDLSGNKLRPAVVLADAGRDDWILCQITSKSSQVVIVEFFSKG